MLLGCASPLWDWECPERKVLSDLKLSKGEERKTCTYGGGPAGCATVIAGVSSTMSYNHV
jgi:hypothetical protein